MKRKRRAAAANARNAAVTRNIDIIEFQEDFVFFTTSSTKRIFKEKKVAHFACGASRYQFICGPLGIDNEPRDARADIVAWAREVAVHAFPGVGCPQ
jgi:hypothetical protein